MNIRFAQPSVLALLGIVLFGATACLSGDAISRSDVLESLVPTVVIPSHEKAADSLQSLSDKARVSCAELSGSDMDDLRDAWRTARSTVSQSRAVLFGPAADRHSTSLINWHTLEPERVDSLLKTGDVASARYVQEFMPATARGLRAIEYILFADLPFDTSRCNYVAAVSEAAAAEVQAVVDEWTGSGTASGKVAYSDVFFGNASSSLLPLSAVSEVVRTSIFLMRTIVDMQLGQALGVDEPMADPTALGEGLAGNGLADLRDVIAGIEAVYAGAGSDGLAIDYSDNRPKGLSDLVAGASDDADVRVKMAFEAALGAIDTLAVRAGSLEQLIANDAESVLAMHSVLKELQITLNTEVVSLLGISVGFADTDGDGG